MQYHLFYGLLIFHLLTTQTYGACEILVNKWNKFKNGCCSCCVKRTERIPIKRYIDLVELDKQLRGESYIQMLIIQFLDLSIDLEYLRIFPRIYKEYILFQRQNNFPIKSLSTKEEWYFRPVIHITKWNTLSMLPQEKSPPEDNYFYLKMLTNINLQNKDCNLFNLILKNYSNIILVVFKQKYDEAFGEGNLSTYKEKNDGMRDLRRNIFYFPNHAMDIAFQLPVRTIFAKIFGDGKTENVIVQPDGWDITVRKMSDVEAFNYEYQYIDQKNKLIIRLSQMIFLHDRKKPGIIRPTGACVYNTSLEIIMKPTIGKYSSLNDKQCIFESTLDILAESKLIGHTLILEYSTHKL